jgi:hypothetical protein
MTAHWPLRVQVALGLVVALSCAAAGCKKKDDTGRLVNQAPERAAAEPPVGRAESKLGLSVRESSESGAARQPVVPGTPGTPAADAQADRARRLIVYHAALRLAVHVVEETLERIDGLAERYGGHVESSSLSQRVLRIPSERYAEAVAELKALGKVLDFRQSTWDVTEKYRDVEARIDNLRVLRARYVELLASAQTMEERLTIERELRRIELELRLLVEELRLLADQAAFATITVDVERIHDEPAVRDRPAQPFRWVREYGLGAVF